MGFGSAHYAGMQQQMPTMSPQRQQQQQLGSGFPSMNPGQMIPRSPNNGMMQPDMDAVLQQQQYQPQPQPQTQIYGNGSYQGYNGGYQGPSSVSPQTHSQTMNPYQAGFPSEPGYPPGASGGQVMGEFGPQAGHNQPMGMPGPASLSLAAMSNRQQFYSDGYGMNPPVSPVQKQMSQGGGFLQPSGMPYSQQVPSYQSGSYPKRPPSSPVQTQMQGFSSGGSSYTPRSSAGMQMPNLPYQSSTNPYQPPRSPSRRSSSTSPHDTATDPLPVTAANGWHQGWRGYSAPSVISWTAKHSADAFFSSKKISSIQDPISKPQKSGCLRAGQLGFEERGSIKKPVAKKVKASSPPTSDPSQGISETAGAVSNSVQCSFKQKATTSKRVAESQKGAPRQQRSASDAERQSVSPPTGNKKSSDENAERKSKESNGSNGNSKTEVSSHSPKMGEGNQKEMGSSGSKGGESCVNVGEEGSQSEDNRATPDKGVGEETTSISSQSTFNIKEEHKEGDAIKADIAESGSNARVPVSESDKTKASLRENAESIEKEEVLSNKSQRNS
ncbi:hypothetical protein ACROYT_G038143 [Oculina patagonica]